MAGGANVLANLAAYEAGVKGGLPGAMQQHFEGSLAYARSNHNWENQSGAAEAGLNIGVGQDGAIIEGGIGQRADTQTGIDDSRSRKWLEIKSSFGGRYKILERARNNNIAALWANCMAIVGGNIKGAATRHYGEAFAGKYSGWK